VVGGLDASDVPKLRRPAYTWTLANQCGPTTFQQYTDKSSVWKDYGASKSDKDKLSEVASELFDHMCKSAIASRC